MSPEITLYIRSGFLRPMHETDVTNDYVLGLNDQQVNRYLEVRHYPQTYESVLSFVRKNKNSSDMILWGIWYGNQTKENLVGTIRLHRGYAVRSLWNIGICLFAKTVWGKGIGSQTISRITEWALNNQDIHCLQAGVHLENIGSQQAFVRARYQFSHVREIQCTKSQKTCLVNIYVSNKVTHISTEADTQAIKHNSDFL